MPTFTDTGNIDRSFLLGVNSAGEATPITVDSSGAFTVNLTNTDQVETFGIPLDSVRNDGGVALTDSAGVGTFGITGMAFGTGTTTLDGQAASGAAITSTLAFEFVLPPTYKAGGSATLQIKAVESVGAATVSTTLTVEVYESNGNGGVGADISGAVSGSGDVTDSWGTFTSALTTSGLQAGDRLICFARLVSDDTGGTVGTVHQVGSIALLLTTSR